MTNVPLLNPQLELEGARKMVTLVEERLDALEQKLLTVPLERDEYLKTIGAVMAIQKILTSLNTQYRTLVNK